MEAPDECGHQGNAEKKKLSVELIDEKVVGFLKNRLEEAKIDYKMLILPDHPTPIVTKTHASDPVPYMIYKKSAEKDSGVDSINEETAKATGVYVDFGPSMMKKFIEE
jgi:2,3-bisphosphoglycerate-independent phosphoglycerate mutase